MTDVTGQLTVRRSATELIRCYGGGDLTSPFAIVRPDGSVSVRQADGLMREASSDEAVALYERVRRELRWTGCDYDHMQERVAALEAALTAAVPGLLHVKSVDGPRIGPCVPDCPRCLVERTLGEGGH